MPSTFHHSILIQMHSRYWSLVVHRKVAVVTIRYILILQIPIYILYLKYTAARCQNTPVTAK